MGYASTTLKRYLPNSFFGVLPLQCGVELALSYVAINRMSGVFGLLSLFTNHAINFMQWMYYSLNIVVLVSTILCYIHVRWLAAQALSNNSLNTDGNLFTIRIIASFVLIFIGEFFTGNVFMVYLANLWLVEEYTDQDSALKSNKSLSTRLIKRVSNVPSQQSASEGYEVFVSLVTIIITEVVRVYFISVILSYYLRLRKRITRPVSGWGSFAVNFLDKLN